MSVSYVYPLRETHRVNKLYVILLILSFEYIGKARCQHYRLSNQSKTLVEWSRDNSCELANLDVIRGHRNVFQYSSVNAWIDQYKPWINFMGCFKRNSRESNVGINAKNKHGNLRIESCFVYCNLSAFVLTRERCICKHQVVLNKTTNGHCSVDLCPDDENAFCPKNGFHDFVCEYVPVPTSPDLGDKGDCMAVEYEKSESGTPKYRSKHCSIKLPYMFKKGNQCKIERQRLSWKEAAKQCSNGRTPVAYSPTDLKNWTKTIDSTFWIGAFRRTLFNKEGKFCLSMSLINGNSSTRITNCSESLQALCITSDLEFKRTEVVNDTQHSDDAYLPTDRVNDTTPTHISTKYMHHSKTDKKVLTVIIASSGGGLLFGVLIGIRAFCKKKRSKKTKTKSFRNEADSDNTTTHGNNECISQNAKMDAVYCEICEILSVKHPKKDDDNNTQDTNYDTLLNSINETGEMYETLEKKH